jgi:hypothetical protein
MTEMPDGFWLRTADANHRQRHFAMGLGLTDLLRTRSTKSYRRRRVAFDMRNERGDPCGTDRSDRRGFFTSCGSSAANVGFKEIKIANGTEAPLKIGVWHPTNASETEQRLGISPKTSRRSQRLPAATSRWWFSRTAVVADMKATTTPHFPLPTQVSWLRQFATRGTHTMTRARSEALAPPGPTSASLLLHAGRLAASRSVGRQAYRCVRFL